MARLLLALFVVFMLLTVLRGLRIFLRAFLQDSSRPAVPRPPEARQAEMVRDPEQKISRPRQIYLGEPTRNYVPIKSRAEPTEREEAVSTLI